MAAAPTSGASPVAARIAVGRRRSALHLATSRSAVVRLAPVVDALAAAGASQAVAQPACARLLAGGEALAALAAGEAPEAAPDAVAAATEAAIEDALPAAVFIAGDGDVAVTCALVAARLGVPIARLGAGARCGDRSSPEEVNRIVLDGLAERLYVDGPDALGRLLDEGVPERRIRRVGSTLADVVARERAAARRRAAWRELGLTERGYVVVAVHRPENIGDDAQLARIVEHLCGLAERVPVLLALHGRTRAMMEPRGDLTRLRTAGVSVVGALPHGDFLSLQSGAGAVLTDSGGIQEETTLLGVACFTLRRATERTLTLTYGTNALLGDDPVEILEVVPGPPAEPTQPIPLWDGQAGRRVAEDFMSWAGT